MSVFRRRPSAADQPSTQAGSGAPTDSAETTPSEAMPASLTRHTRPASAAQPARSSTVGSRAAEQPAATERTVSAPSGGSAADAAASLRDRKLIVGRGISLSGEITACDHLVVEGRIEVRLKDCRIVEIAEGGVFKGSADVHLADIGGRFDGDLSVRERLNVQGAGVISGSVRYGEIAVAAGGRLVGRMEPMEPIEGLTDEPKTEVEEPQGDAPPIPEAPPQDAKAKAANGAETASQAAKPSTDKPGGEPAATERARPAKSRADGPQRRAG